MGFAKNQQLHLDPVSTTCGSGWVDDELAISLLEVDPPATAGGTDIDPTAILFTWVVNDEFRKS